MVKVYQLTGTQQVDPRGFLAALVADGAAVVHLRRENLLRHALSNTFAEHRGTYHDRTAGPRPRLEVDPARLVAVMRRRREHGEREAEALAGIDHLELVYERDLLSSARFPATAERVFRHIGLGSAPVGTDLRRSVSGRIADRVDNHAELVGALAGTEWARYLDDRAYG